MTPTSAARLADEELMVLVQDGDSGAVEVLYDRHGGPAYSLAHRIMGERQAAEDVTQEAFLSVWRTSASYDAARGSVRSWLLQIVRNRAIDALRRSSVRGGRLDYDDEGLLEAQEEIKATLRDLPIRPSLIDKILEELKRIDREFERLAQTRPGRASARERRALEAQVGLSRRQFRSRFAEVRARVADWRKRL